MAEDLSPKTHIHAWVEQSVTWQTSRLAAEGGLSVTVLWSCADLECRALRDGSYRLLPPGSAVDGVEDEERQLMTKETATSGGGLSPRKTAECPGLLAIWIAREDTSKGPDGEWSQPNNGRLVTTKELLDQLGAIAKELDQFFPYSSPEKLGISLRSMKLPLSRDYDIDRVRRKNGSCWRFRVR